MPAIQAALDAPGFPPGPSYRWPRSFPPEASSALLPPWPDDPEDEDRWLFDLVLSNPDAVKLYRMSPGSTSRRWAVTTDLPG